MGPSRTKNKPNGEVAGGVISLGEEGKTNKQKKWEEKLLRESCRKKKKRGQHVKLGGNASRKKKKKNVKGGGRKKGLWQLTPEKKKLFSPEQAKRPKGHHPLRLEISGERTGWC